MPGIKGVRTKNGLPLFFSRAKFCEISLLETPGYFKCAALLASFRSIIIKSHCASTFKNTVGAPAGEGAEKTVNKR